MSWLGRMLGRSGAPSAAVVIPDDLAAELTAQGAPLHDAVVGALRDQLAARRREAGRTDEGGMPFWLTREGERDDIESELRDRIAQRRAEEEAAEATPKRRGRTARRDPDSAEQ